MTPGWLATHSVALLLVVGMLGLAGWQFTRATGGNALSWGYAAQWPAFAGFVVVIWFREARRTLQGEPDSPPLDSGASPAPAAASPAAARGLSGVVDEDTDDPELAAYNRFLAWLSANPGARPVDYPG